MGTAAILLAAGSGSRLRGMDNKVFFAIGGRPLLAWTTRAFTACDAIDQLVIVTRAGEQRRVESILAGEQSTVPVRIVVGGPTRSDSELSGLEALATDIDDGTVDVVLIHDAARPFASPAMIAEVAATAHTVGGAVPTLPVDERVCRRTPDGRIVSEIDGPGDLHRAQTPQGFSARELLAAYRCAARDGFHGLDTAQTVDRYVDLEIAVVPGEHTNIKVTYPDDLHAAEEIASAHVR